MKTFTIFELQLIKLAIELESYTDLITKNPQVSSRMAPTIKDYQELLTKTKEVIAEKTKVVLPNGN
jgi:hypothetical protein